MTAGIWRQPHLTGKQGQSIRLRMTPADLGFERRARRSLDTLEGGPHGGKHGPRPQTFSQPIRIIDRDNRSHHASVARQTAAAAGVLVQRLDGDLLHLDPSAGDDGKARLRRAQLRRGRDRACRQPACQSQKGLSRDRCRRAVDDRGELGCRRVHPAGMVSRRVRRRVGMIVPMLMPRMCQRRAWGSQPQHQARQEDGEGDVGYGRCTHGSFAADLTLGGRFGAHRKD
jgi:hypothetical protein